jgi:hypothetical protein
MKSQNHLCKYLVSSGFALVITALAWLPSQALAQEKGAQKLMKVQTVEDLQTLDAGDVVIMSCPKCKDSYATVVEKTFKGAKPEELKNVTIHLCSSCDTKIVTKGSGKQAKDTLVHTCKECGSKDVTCCAIKKGSLPTPGMEEGKK